MSSVMKDILQRADMTLHLIPLVMNGVERLWKLVMPLLVLKWVTRLLVTVSWPVESVQIVRKALCRQLA